MEVSGTSEGERNGGVPSDVDHRLKERAMDEAPVGITIADARKPDLPLVYVNDSFTRVTGYSREEVLGRNCRFLQGPATEEEPVARMREAIEAGERVTVELRNYRKDGEQFWNRVNIAPIRDETGSVTHYVGFQMDITDRKEAEAAVRAEREAMARLVERVNGLVGDVTRELVHATDGADLRRRVCQRLVEADPYLAAWMGEPDLSAEAVHPEEGTLAVADGVGSIPLDGPVESGPCVEALRTGELRVVTLGPSDHPAARSMAAVPLTYQETSYGVLAVYGEAPDTFDDRETVVLTALARSVATALNALESRRILTTEPTTEVVVSLRDDTLFEAALTARADCRLEYVGSMERSDGTPALTYTVEGDVGEALADPADLPGVREVSVVVDHGDRRLVDFTLDGDSIVGTLAQLGARTESIVAEDGSVTVTTTLPAEADSRRFLARLEDRYDGVSLLAHREYQRKPETVEGFVSRLTEELTDRQLVALRRAYTGGYFERPRPVDGEALAESMGISRSTFHQHLRTAERKLLTAFFEDGGRPVDGT